MAHPAMPLGLDGGGVEVVYVSRFDPAVLAEWVVDAVLIVAVSGGVGTHVGSEFKGVVSVLGVEDWSSREREGM